MTYVDGFVVAVPTDKRDAYREHAEAALPMFKGYGATRMVEGWGDDVPRGEVNDLYGAVEAKDDETVLFSWIEYPDKAARDAAAAQIMAAPEMHALAATMPFDGRRMIYGGFDVVVDTGTASDTGYVDGFLMPAGDREAYVAMATRAEAVFRDHGATRVVEGWASDVSPGKVTGFPQALRLQDGETVVFSWIEWPSKAVRDAGMARVMDDERMQMTPEAMPFDGKRMVYGGFVPLFRSDAPA